MFDVPPHVSIVATALVVGLLAGHPAWAGYREGRVALKAKNYELALKEFRKATDEGHARAQFRLGYMYEKGLGVGKDDEMARKWYLVSAEQDNVRGQHQLAQLSEERSRRCQ